MNAVRVSYLNNDAYQGWLKQTKESLLFRDVSIAVSFSIGVSISVEKSLVN